MLYRHEPGGAVRRSSFFVGNFVDRIIDVLPLDGDALTKIASGHPASTRGSGP
jgi:hypothetical protein